MLLSTGLSAVSVLSIISNISWYPHWCWSIDSDNPFILETDGGLGTVLGQKQSDGHVHQGWPDQVQTVSHHLSEMENPTLFSFLVLQRLPPT